MSDSTPEDDLDLERLAMLRDLDPDDTSYLDRAIGNFVSNASTVGATAREAALRGDHEELRAVTHKMVGNALNLGLNYVGAAARRLELLAGEGTTEGAAALLDDLDRALARGREDLLAFQASYQASPS
ncbi:Hpt domain-containing protein [Nocardioides ochotonae]|uniref:Hpt domain-containing protein n=1 Tax=Nocardioides ochotonae TaxID=2685869 RepID=UPI00140E842D|nr:Hpt domain-containing protein [Nocardioides ochotonae]